MEKQLPTINDIPAPPNGVSFTLGKIETVVLPHPYCITSKHLEYADSMYLDNSSLKRAESKGAACDICKKAVRAGQQNRILSIDEHESQLTLFIVVPQNKDLNAVEGLGTYLSKLKDEGVWEKLGIQGFAFPTAAQSA